MVGYWGAESQDILQKYEEASGVSFSSLYESINKKDV
jgi:hypothetical protein